MIGASDIRRVSEMERQARHQAEAEAWPDGVIARYLTVAGATVDISYASHSGVIIATCTGERCGWEERTDTYCMVYDPPEKEDARVERWLPDNQQEAQAHAEKCRALPRPTG